MFNRRVAVSLRDNPRVRAEPIRTNTITRGIVNRSRGLGPQAFTGWSGIHNPTRAVGFAWQTSVQR